MVSLPPADGRMEHIRNSVEEEDGNELWSYGNEFYSHQTNSIHDPFG
jgi:hypothetical protein